MATIKWETAKHMMNIVAFTCVYAAQEQGKEPDVEGIEEFTRKMFRQYCEVENITTVEEEAEEEEETEDENKYCDSAADLFFCNSDDEEQNEDEEEKHAITLKEQLVLGLMQTGMSLEEANARADMFLQLLEYKDEEEDEDEEVEVEIKMDVNVDENGNFECSTTKGDLVLALMQAGYSFDQACAAVGIFGKEDE